MGEGEKRIRLGSGAFDGVGGVCGLMFVKRVDLGVGLVRSVQLSYGSKIRIHDFGCVTAVP